jgi:hypothetical protein
VFPNVTEKRLNKELEQDPDRNGRASAKRDAAFSKKIMLNQGPKAQ